MTAVMVKERLGRSKKTGSGIENRLKAGNNMFGTVRGGAQLVPTATKAQIIAIKKGYDVQKVKELQEKLGITEEKLAKTTNISLATLHRRKASGGRLTQEESDKVYRIQKIYDIAIDVLETQERVKSWINASQVVFGGATPLEYAETLPGAEEVGKVLRRIDQGIFS